MKLNQIEFIFRRENVYNISNMFAKKSFEDTC